MDKASLGVGDVSARFLYDYTSNTMLSYLSTVAFFSQMASASAE
jgi:hypothetical protein